MYLFTTLVLRYDKICNVELRRVCMSVGGWTSKINTYLAVNPNFSLAKEAVARVLATYSTLRVPAPTISPGKAFLNQPGLPSTLPC